MDANDFNMYCECSDGFTGVRCDQRLPNKADTKLFIICIASAVLLFSILAFSMYLCKRFNENPCRKRSPPQTESSLSANGVSRHEDANEQNTDTPLLLPQQKNPAEANEEAIPLKTIQTEEETVSIKGSGDGFSTTVH